MKKNGFTLIELVVVIAIIAILSLIILFAVLQYINKSKDSNASGNLAVLIPAGETYYNIENANNGDGYHGFCASTSSVVKNAFSQMPTPSPVVDCASGSFPGLCCNVNSNNETWAACAQEFTDKTQAYCVDSRGVKEGMANSSCTTSLTQCP